jgi:hypothetical protein
MFIRKKRATQMLFNRKMEGNGVTGVKENML